MVDIYKINLGKAAVPEVVSMERKSIPEWVDRDSAVALISGSHSILIDKNSGRVTSISATGNAIQVNGPELQMLPLTTGPCDTEHSLDIKPLNNTCANWKGRVTDRGTDKNGPWVKVDGTYDEAGITLTYRMDSIGSILIDYQFVSKIDIDPRQIGLVFSLPGDYQILSWDRNAQWSVYPEDHIGRPSGWAKPFPDGKQNQFRFGVRPEWSWSTDQTPMGSNDFRATRERIKWAELLNESSQGIRISSNGEHAVRAWVADTRIQLLVASFFTGGGDMFFASHHQKERKPLKKGDTFRGSLSMTVL
jgi:hypothetical protein